ncbi:hypothetical protein ALP29_201137 [Pseudomonas syringae pv. avii]|uniref:Uncharacterized protein n=1 Tax=Pseudomonas syringae pv. avii TaxID=663959 RepID=A0A3M5UKK8_PSESX|nr:hypothetical protein ALP29_201137 [Pseudomonas syringae pv. avii]
MAAEPVALITRYCRLSSASVSAMEITITTMLNNGAPSGSGFWMRSTA